MINLAWLEHEYIDMAFLKIAVYSYIEFRIAGVYRSSRGVTVELQNYCIWLETG